VTDIDSLRNVLELERRKGYTDKAVIGGLDKYLHKQAGQIRQSLVLSLNEVKTKELIPQLLSGFDELNLARSNYGSYGPDERKRWMANVLGWLDEMEGKTKKKSSQESGVSRQESVASRQETEVSSQETEDRRQKTEYSNSFHSEHSILFDDK